MKITHVDHACFLFETAGATIVTDPFSSDISAALKKTPRLYNPDYVLLTHAHGDHMGNLKDVVGEKTTVVAIVELAEILQALGYKTIGVNFGGELTLGKTRVAVTRAVHTSSMRVGGKTLYAGEPCGYVISDNPTSAYFAGDTDVFSDMQLIKCLYKPVIAILPVGGHYTMDVKKAIFACNNLLETEVLIPMHYDTFPLIRADLSPLKNQLDKAKVVILDKGESAEF